MKKTLSSLGYLIQNPVRAKKIYNLYQHLKGKYRFTILFTHAFKESVYKKIHTTTKSNQKDKNKFFEGRPVIINIHDGILHSGGLTDRLKGMCTLYAFAKKNNYDFKIHFVFPFKLEKYLIPNLYDWTIEAEDIDYNLKETGIYTWENEKFVDSFIKENSQKKQLHISCNSWECAREYSQLFNELFLPSPYLKEHLDNHLSKLNGAGNYISISLRFQSLLGEFKEGKSTSMDVEKQQLLIQKCLKIIHELKLKHPEIQKILITSDSNLFREIANETYSYAYTYVLPDEVGHMDYAAAGKSKELTAFLDMFLISNAKKAYQVRTKEMYNSDFPHMAARINNVPYEMLLLS